jgi:peptide/nickel transport system substrate-binding protein
MLRGIGRCVQWLVCAALFATCGGGREAAVAVPEATDERPVDGGTLVRRLDADITTLNPVLISTRNDRYVANYLFTPVIYLDAALRPLPGLASSWEISPDGRSYRFHLNPAATFSDGRKVRASDLVFTLRKIAEPATGAALLYGWFESLDTRRTRAIDETTAEVVFRQPFAGQLIRFADVFVLPEHIYSRGDFRAGFEEFAVGSGPYRLIERSPGVGLVLSRRATFWHQRPFIQTVRFKVISDHVTAWKALERGEIDETMITTDQWLRQSRTASRAITLHEFHTLQQNVIAWNNRHPLLGDAKLRRYLAMSIRVDEIVRHIYHSTARPLTGPFVPGQWAYHESPFHYDAAGALRGLASIGWIDRDGDGIREKDGTKLRFQMIIMTASKDVGQIIQANLRRAGADVDVVLMDGTSAIERIFQGNYEAAYLGWELDPDPDPFGVLHSSQGPPRGQNVVFYSNAAADRLIDQARREFDQNARTVLYRQLQDIVAPEQPYTWLVQPSMKWAIRSRVRGVAASPSFGLFRWYPGELAWWIRPE